MGGYCCFPTMLIKNVCSRVVKLEDFPLERPIAPGGVVDLSLYPIADREKSVHLKNLFTKGDLICLGYAPINPQVKAAMGVKTSLAKHAVVPETLYQSDVIVPARTMKPVINAGRNKNELMPKIQSTPSRYNKEALTKFREETERAAEGIIPQFQEKAFTNEQKSTSFTQIQSDDEILTISLDEATGTTYVQDAPGFIKKDFSKDPSVFVDNHIPKEDPEFETRRGQHRAALKEKLEKKIIELVEAKCLSPKVDGTPCSLPVLKGCNACWQHLSNDEKKKVLARRKSGLFK